MAFCITCGTIIPLNLKNPFCKKCLDSYNSFDLGASSVMPPYYCHSCGKDSYVSDQNPLCSDCYIKFNYTHHM